MSHTANDFSVPCEHPKARTKRYVGSAETYQFCPDCLHTWGGEEGPRKRSLLDNAARADVTEAEECASSITGK